MANKYGQMFNFSGCTCATCAYSDTSDRKNGKYIVSMIKNM